MSKLKNCNILLSVILSIIALPVSLYNVFYIADRYPISANGLLLFISALLILFSILLLLAGVFTSGKTLISLSGVFLFLQSVVFIIHYIYSYVFSGMYNHYYRPNIFLEVLNFILLLLPIAAYLLLILYAQEQIKNSRMLFSALFVAWLVVLFTSSSITPELLILSSLILLTKYVDITKASSSVKMGEVFILSIVTFGIYYILWSIFAAKKTEMFIGKKASFSELWLFSLFYPYTAYWYYTRYEELSEKDETVKNRGILCMVLTLFLLFPMALCILQRDLNRLSETISSSDATEKKDEPINIEEAAEAECENESDKAVINSEQPFESHYSPSEEA